MTQSAPRRQGRWNRLHEGRQRRSGSRFSRTPKPPSDGWLRRCLALVNIAALRRAKPGITIEIRWCPAHKGVQDNGKADEWAKVAAEEPDTCGVEWLNYSDRTEALPMPLPRSLANLKRGISGKKRVEAGRWAGPGPPGRSTKCRKNTSRTARLLGVPRGSLQGIAN